MGIFRCGSAKSAQDDTRSTKQAPSQAGAAGDDQELRKLKDNKCPSSTGSTLASSKCADFRYTRFNIPSVPGEKHAVFIPESVQLTQSVFAQICSALNREVPSAFLKGTGSVRHPSRMSSPQLRGCSSFQQLVSEAQRSLGLRRDAEASGDGECCCQRPRTRSSEGVELAVEEPEMSNLPIAVSSGDMSALVGDVADRMLERKLAAATCHVADAASRSNVWTFTGPRISSFELLLQRCIEGGRTDIFRLAAAHLQDQAFMESHASRQLLRDLWDKSQTLSSEAVEKAGSVTLPADLWDNSTNTLHRDFLEHGWDQWSFETLDNELSRGHPITQWPWPYADLFMFFYRERQPASSVIQEVDWDYRTPARLDLQAVPITADALAPVSHIFFGSSEPGAKKRLLQAMKGMSPVVLMDNTPNAVKQMCLLVRIIKRAVERDALPACRPFLADGAEASPGSGAQVLQALVPSKVLRHVEQEFNASGMDSEERLALSDVVGLLDLAQKRPQVFKDMVCVVEPLQGAQEKEAAEMVQAFTACSSSRGLSVAAMETSLVMQGWRVHRRMMQVAAQLQRRATATFVTIALLLFLSAVLATIVVSLRIEAAEFKAEGGHQRVVAPLRGSDIRISYTQEDVLVLRALLVLMPISAGLLAALQSRRQTPEKWAATRAAASHVVSEIHCFLGGIGPYRAGFAANQKRFTRRLRAIEQEHLGKGGLHDSPRASLCLDEGFPQDSDELQQHINLYLYGISPSSWLGRRVTSLRILFGARLLESDGPKAPTAPLSSDMYMERRISPLRRYYREKAVAMSRVSSVLYWCALVCLVIVWLFAILGWGLWIPIPLGLAVLLKAFSQWFASAESLTALTNALKVLDLLDLRWQRSDIRDNRSPATKARLITVTERVSHTVDCVLARAPVVPEDDEDMESADGGPDGAGRLDTSTREARQRPISLVVGGASGTNTPLSIPTA